MANDTLPRAGRAGRLLASFQSAKGTAVSDFTAAARVWTEDFALHALKEKTRPGPWMTELFAEHADSRHSYKGPNRHRLTAQATYQLLDLLLRSNWGPGVAYTLRSQVATTDWLSLGWVENVASGATENLVRSWNAWCHRLALKVEGTGYCHVEAEFASEKVDDAVALNALGGITLPAAPMTPTDQNVFTGRDTTLTRDPLGAAVALRFHELTLTLDQRLVHDWDQMQQVYDVYKGGKTEVLLEVRGRLGDETWELLKKNRAGTKQRYRLVSTAPAPARTLTVNLYEVDFHGVDEVGHDGQGGTLFRALGRAHRDDSGNFVSITLT